MEEQVIVRNYPGIHAHPAVLFVKRASLFKSEVSVSNGSLTVNGKSIMGVLMLAAETGVVLTIRATGPDEGEAVTALVHLVDSRFEEGA
jgi:phosphocarrier protein HPr